MNFDQPNQSPVPTETFWDEGKIFRLPTDKVRLEELRIKLEGYRAGKDNLDKYKAFILENLFKDYRINPTIIERLAQVRLSPNFDMDSFREAGRTIIEDCYPIPK